MGGDLSIGVVVRTPVGPMRAGLAAPATVAIPAQRLGASLTAAAVSIWSSPSTSIICSCSGAARRAWLGNRRTCDDGAYGSDGVDGYGKVFGWKARSLSSLNKDISLSSCKRTSLLTGRQERLSRHGRPKR
jgi:hypothetical protein